MYLKIDKEVNELEISRISSGTTVKTEKKIVSNNKGFSKNFNFAQQKKSQQQLKKMLNDIKKKGDRLAITKCYVDVLAYKRMIKEYLDSVLSYMYKVKQDVSFWQTQYFVTVETIDSKMEELTEMLLSQEKQNIDIASTIDEISGLVVDIYK